MRTRKLLLLLVLALAVALPAEAIAKTKRYSGPVSPSGTISFSVTKKKGKKRKTLSNVRIAGIPLTCAEGPYTTSGFFSSTRTFRQQWTISGTNSRGGQTVIQGTVAAGTLQLTGTYPVDPVSAGTFGTNCQTGVRTWTAARV
jgi:hypothetical protein